MQFHEMFSEDELEILRLRAERIAAPLQEENKTGRISALVARMHGETYVLPIDAITMVIRNVALFPIPCVPKFVAGIANVRGHLVTVLDLAVLLGLESKDETSSSVLVVVEADDISIGFHVESIGEVIELSMSDLNPMSPAIHLAHPEYLQGIFPDGTGLLNLPAILQDSRLEIDETVG